MSDSPAKLVTPKCTSSPGRMVNAGTCDSAISSPTPTASGSREPGRCCRFVQQLGKISVRSKKGPDVLSRSWPLYAAERKQGYTGRAGAAASWNLSLGAHVVFVPSLPDTHLPPQARGKLRSCRDYVAVVCLVLLECCL